MNGIDRVKLKAIIYWNIDKLKYQVHDWKYGGAIIKYENENLKDKDTYLVFIHEISVYEWDFWHSEYGFLKMSLKPN